MTSFTWTEHFTVFAASLGSVVMVIVAFWCLLFAIDWIGSLRADAQNRNRRAAEIRDLTVAVMEGRSPYDDMGICAYCGAYCDSRIYDPHAPHCEWQRLEN